jgi:hypothetical protein
MNRSIKYVFETAGDLFFILTIGLTAIGIIVRIFGL